MSSPFDPLADVIHSRSLDSWNERNKSALLALIGTRYAKRAEQAVKLRAPEMKANPDGVSYASYINPDNPDVGSYGGTSFAIFPGEDAPCLVAMVIGTNGLHPDQTILGRPGHARKMQAICKWLNQSFGKGTQIAWAKQDPTLIDIDIPSSVQDAWPGYRRVFKKYGRYCYALFRPPDDRSGTIAALTALLDILFQERGQPPLAEYQADASSIQSAWFECLMPNTTRNEVIGLVNARRYVIIQGPPGTGKTRMARALLKDVYGNFGESIQFHPNTTYETFIGGLSPIQTDETKNDSLGFRFAPTPGFLIEAAAQAYRNPERNFLLHIDEINRADLGKILGEAIYLFESKTDDGTKREIKLPYDFGTPFFRTLALPTNLHILGTMNSADRSIAILDVAVRRRFAFLSLWPERAAVKECGCELSLAAFDKLVTTFVEHSSDEVLSLVPGHSYFLDNDEKHAKQSMRTGLIPLLVEYLNQGYVSGFAEPIRAYMQWLESLCSDEKPYGS